jgi:ribonuclease BN (tRNA processing enzyme)
MKLTILGKWSPYPPAGGACPGYLVDADGTRVLLDCGSGVAGSLHRFCTVFDLDAVVISHLHPDHFTDIYPLRNELAFGRMPVLSAPPMMLFAPADALERLAGVMAGEASRREFTSGFTLHPLEDGRGQVGGLQLRFVRTSHPTACHAVEVRSGARRLVYSADTGPSAEVERLAAGCDLFLCENTLLEGDEALVAELGHLTARMAGAMASRAGVRRLLLTHFFTPRHAVKDSLAAAAKEFGAVEAAEEGVTYEV